MRKGNRLFYMFAETPADDPKSIPKTQLAEYKKEAKKGNGKLEYTWAKDADHARRLLKSGKGERYSGIFNLSGDKLVCKTQKPVIAILKGKQGTIGNISQILTSRDVSEVLSNQPLNKGIPISDLSEKWIASSTFHKMSVPVDIIGIATEPLPGALPVARGPIIVDLNINELGRIKSEFGTHGKPPDVLVLDGKHRLSLVKKQGQRVIEAFVGDEAVPFVERAYKRFDAKRQEMIDISLYTRNQTQNLASAEPLKV